MGFGIEAEFETVFIGRTDELRNLQTSWNTKRMFGNYGMRTVGTSRLAKEFLISVKTQYDELVYVNFKEISDITQMYVNMCAQLKLFIESQTNDINSWENLLFSAVSSSKREYVLFFDNMEYFLDNQSAIRKRLQSICVDLIKLDNVKVVLTSTTTVLLANVRHVYHVCELHPLKADESSELLKAEARDVDYGEYLDRIVHLSEGLPLLLLMIASELRENRGMLTAKDMAQLLADCRLPILSREFYPEEDRVSHVYQQFISRLSHSHRSSYSELDYIPGSFTADEAGSIIDAPTDVEHRVLIPMVRRHFLNYDSTSRRFNIQGILRECIKTFFSLRNAHIPEVRVRYIKTFTDVMRSISWRYSSQEYASALADFAFEQPNLQKLLLEIQYTTQDTYAFFIQMATESSKFIERYLSGYAEKFYSECHRAADRYGTTMDKAVIDLAVGSLYTNVKTICNICKHAQNGFLKGNFKEGYIKCSAALRILQRGGKSLQLATAYQRIGYNLLHQDENEEGINNFKKSLAISSVSGKQFNFIAIQSLNSLGTALAKLGRFKEAEKYYFSSLQKSRITLGHHHPNVGTALNNIGRMYHQKHDEATAMKYLQEGLEIKKKSKAADLSQIDSLINIANTYIAVGEFAKATQALEESEVIVSRQYFPPLSEIATIHDTWGTVYLKQGQLDKAADMFNKAAQERGTMTYGGTPHVESLVNVIKVAAKKGDYRKCIQIGKQVLLFSDNVLKQRPQTIVISDCYECLANAYEKTGNLSKAKVTLESLKLELIRLGSLHDCDSNNYQLLQIQKRLKHIEHNLQSDTFTNDN